MNDFGIDTRKAERYRVAAYVFFFACLAVLLVGLVPAMYYSSGIGVLVSLILAAAFFFMAFFTGGIGWSRFDEPLSTRTLPEPPTEVRDTRTLETGLEPPPSLEGEPYRPPSPSDQSPPP